ncbi:MAG: type IV pilus modification protein PilV [Burkholderiaceae bacterium]
MTKLSCISARPRGIPVGQRSFSSARQAHGFSLVEVLISIIILSFGMLGMVGLQASALQANREARQQSIASGLAGELAEMMRNNKDIGLLTTANPYLGAFTSPLTPATASYCLNVATGTAACANAGAIADAQMTEWLTRVDNALAGARVVVCADSAPYDANGLPQWACDTTGTGVTTVIKIGWTRGATNRAATGAAAFDLATRPSIVLPITPGNTV